MIATVPPGSISGTSPPDEPAWWQRLWKRELSHYPDTLPRYVNLAIVVVAAIVLYYEFYVQSAVATLLLPHFGMTFPFFVYAIVVGNFIGAFASLLAGLSDRWGRANLVAYGLLATALVTLYMPHSPNLWVYAVLYSILGFVEGIILVATPALIRDFSPQLGRASAMGFWTLGPVIASLTVSQVSSHTLNHLTAFQDQFTIAAVTGLVIFAIALVGLRELSPGLRDQLMVSVHDRMLIEAKAAGVDVEQSLAHPWKQMLRPDLVLSSLGIGVFLVVYYTLIAFLVPFMASIFHYTPLRANLLGNWVWASNAVGLIVVGVVSDRMRVRKPFMILGVAIAMAATGLFAVTTTDVNTTYYTFAAILSVMAIGLGFGFSPWLAAYTETVEDRNPALMATGLAVWGWVLRVVVAGSLFILPFVVTSMTPIVEHGTQVEAVAAKYGPQLQTLAVIDSSTLAKLTANPTDSAAIGTAVGEISKSLNVTPGVAVQRLVAVSQVPKADLAFVQKYGPGVQKAAAAAPHEWQRWWWVCFGTEALLIPAVFLLKGRWSPKRAKEDDAAHEAFIEAELTRMAH